MVFRVLREHWTGAGNKMDPEMGVAGTPSPASSPLPQAARNRAAALPSTRIDETPSSL